jgi:fructoselysine 6-kinase
VKTAEELQDQLNTVPAPSVVGVGDNVLDCYIDEELAFPGGNALNIAVYSTLFFGAHSGFVGIFGTDRFADHLRSTLDDVGVDHSRSRTAIGQNGMAFVRVDADGDRRFVGSNWGGVQAELRLRMTPFDLDYLAGFGVVHTSAYSSLTTDLAAIAENSEVSFDFSTVRDAASIEQVAAHVSVGFLSGEGLSDADVDALGRFAVDAGMDRVVLTQGSRGAKAFDRSGVTTIGIQQTHVVDTLGAGDGFITGFIAARSSGAELDECLHVAATSGALACTRRGAFGYPVEAGADARRQMTRTYESV